jgi:oxaloacetate decarboxylase alpha subunit
MARVAERPSPRPKRGRAKPVAAAAAPAPGSANVKVAGFSLRELNRLIRLVQRTGIGELELNDSGRSVRISANSAGAVVPAHLVAAATRPAAAQEQPPEAGAAPATPAKEPASNRKPIVSPMVGTFYRSPAPDAEPFVEVGDVVELGQTVCIIEAMKLMNEIEAETKGRLVEILVENAQPVEFGQKLFLVEPL